MFLFIHLFVLDLGIVCFPVLEVLVNEMFSKVGYATLLDYHPD